MQEETEQLPQQTEENFLSFADFTDELQIMDVWRFTSNSAIMRKDDFDTDPVYPYTPSVVDKIIKGTMLIRDQAWYFSQVLDFVQEGKIHISPLNSIEQIEDKQQETQTKQKVFACKIKTIWEMEDAMSKSVQALDSFLVFRRREEELLTQQVKSLKQRANFTTFDQLRIFQRCCLITDYLHYIFMNLYHDGYQYQAQKPEQTFLPIERDRENAESTLKIKLPDDSSTVMNSYFFIVIKKGEQIIYTSGPSQQSTEINQIVNIRNKYIENAMIYGWIKDQIPSGKISLLQTYTIEFTLVQNPEHFERRSELYLELLNTILKRHKLTHYLEYIKEFLVVYQGLLTQSFIIFQMRRIWRLSRSKKFEKNNIRNSRVFQQEHQTNQESLICIKKKRNSCFVLVNFCVAQIVSGTQSLFYCE